MAEFDPRDARISQLETLLERALTKIAEQDARIASLERQLSQNSQNSSKPPSSDAPGSRGASAPSGRKPGGQPGHKGHKRAVLPAERIDERKVLKPKRCRRCHVPLSGEDASPLLHQVVEIPVVRAHVTQYELHRLTCACGTRTCAALPEGVSASNFGPQLTALVAVLMGRFRMAKREVRSFLQEVTDVQLSVGSVVGMQQTASDALAEAYAEAVELAHDAPVQHADETGWREMNLAAWLWTVATVRATVFRIANSRSSDAARAVLSTRPGVITVTDRFSGYAYLDDDHRQLCWAHLLRDFRGLSEQRGMAGVVGGALVAHADELFQLWHRVRDKEISPNTFRRRLANVKHHVQVMLRIGSVFAEKRAAGLCRRLLKQWPALWRFEELEGVEPTNNLAERALRPAVLWRKGCFGTRSAHGSRFAERMLTVIATLRPTNRNVLRFVADAVLARFAGHATPKLLATA